MAISPSTITETHTVPVYKAGAVITRSVGDGRIEFLITRPLPTRDGTAPKWVLPRGSRQYRDAQEQWVDARDAETAQRHAAQLEPLTRTIAREMSEEAGLPPETLRSAHARIYEMGVRNFNSSSKPPYEIYWVTIHLDEQAQQTMVTRTPHIMEPIRWVTRETMGAMAAQGEFSAGYLPIVDEAARLLANPPAPRAWTERVNDQTAGRVHISP